MKRFIEDKRLNLVVILLLVLTIPLGFFYVFTMQSYFKMQDSKRYSDIPSFTEVNSGVVDTKAGSCSVLTGDCVLVNIFLTDYETGWTDSEINSVNQQMNDAKAFIEKQAVSYDKKVNIITGKSDLTVKLTCEFVIPTQNGDWAANYLYQTFPLDATREKIKKQYHTENIGFLFHVNKTSEASSSFCNQYIGDMEDEYTVFYTKYAGDKAPQKSIYAHEILHLFGAVDLYLDGAKSLAKKNFPKDAMFVGSDNLDKLNIGDFTAYCIGWKTSYDLKYNAFFDAKDAKNYYDSQTYYYNIINQTDKHTNDYGNKGSCKTLEGDCLVVSIFLSDSEATWSDAEIQSTMSQMKETKTFLESQAAKYKKKLNLICDKSDLIYKVNSSKPLPNVPSLYQWASDVLHEQVDGQKLYFDLTKKYNTKNIAFCLYTNKSGISYTFPFNGSEQEEYIEVSVLFGKDQNNAATTTGTYTHLLLELFGATDLSYYGLDEESAKVAAKDFPNDVMVRDSNDLNQLNVGEVTAYCIGWKNNCKSEYKSLFF